MAWGDGGFIFGGDTGLTYEQLKQRRAIAAALAARQKGPPKNVGEGLTYLGDSFAEAMGTLALKRGEERMRQQSGDVYKNAPPGPYTGGGTTTQQPPPAPAKTSDAGPTVGPITLADIGNPFAGGPAMPAATTGSGASLDIPSGFDLAGDMSAGTGGADLAGDIGGAMPQVADVQTSPPPEISRDVALSDGPATLDNLVAAAPELANAQAFVQEPKPGVGDPLAPIKPLPGTGATVTPNQISQSASRETFFNPSPEASQRDRITIAAMQPVAGPAGGIVAAGPAAGQDVVPSDEERLATIVGDQTPAPTSSTQGPAEPIPAPQFNARRIAAIDANPQVSDAITQAAARYNLPVNLLKTVAHIESGGRYGPESNTGSYKGLFQLSNSEFAKHGSGGNIYDPYANAQAAASIMAQNAATLRQALGRDPTPNELYMAHQQGIGGVQAHIANPDRPAWQSMYSTAEGQQKGPAWSKLAIWGNVPDSEKARFGSVENVTSGDLMKIYEARIGGGDVAVAGVVAPAGGGSTGGGTGSGAAGGAAATAAPRDLVTEAILEQQGLQAPQGQQTAQQAPQDGQDDRLRDVMGLNRPASFQSRPTAALGRAGVATDASLPPVSPMGTLGGAELPTRPEAPGPTPAPPLPVAMPSMDPTAAGSPARIVTPAQSPTITDIRPAPDPVVPGAQYAQAQAQPQPQPAPAQAAPERPLVPQYPDPGPRPTLDSVITPQMREGLTYWGRQAANPYIDDTTRQYAADRYKELVSIANTELGRADQFWQQQKLKQQELAVQQPKSQADLDRALLELQLGRQNLIQGPAGASVGAQPGAQAPAAAPAPAPAPSQQDPRLGTPQSPQRSGVPTLPPPPPGSIPNKWAEEQTKKAIKDAEAVQKAGVEFGNSIDVLNQIKTHPGRAYGIGFGSSVARSIQGTDAYGFGKLVDQVAGQNFLQAYQQLKGAGAITEIEGAKAEAAQARLAAAQNETDFNKAMHDLETTIRSNMELAQRRMNLPVTAWRAQGDNYSYAPDIGQQRDIKNGSGREEYIGGNPGSGSSWRRVQ